MFWEKPFDHAINRLKKQVHAPVRLVLWDGREVAFSDAPSVTVRLKGTRAASAFVRPSMLSLAEAYIEGHADLEGDLREAIRGAEAISRSSNGGALFDSAHSARHSRRDDREAIRHHYDVSNAFYALWLDPRMVYSCAYFKTDDDTLEQAQAQKLDHICRKLRLAPGEKFLDIGCGWGALAIHAAREYGVDATGITLSDNQYQLAHERIREAGLEARCKVLLLDYRDMPGEGVFDKIASVGMFEHVGLRNLPTYFGVVRRLLRDKGLFLNHGITSTDTDNRAVGMGAGEFIARYVFPRGELPHAASRRARHVGAGPRGARRGEPAPALREDAVDVERELRAPLRAGARRLGRAHRPHLAHLPRRLRARLRAGVDEHPPGPRLAAGHARALGRAAHPGVDVPALAATRSSSRAASRARRSRPTRPARCRG